MVNTMLVFLIGCIGVGIYLAIQNIDSITKAYYKWQLTKIKLEKERKKELNENE